MTLEERVEKLEKKVEFLEIDGNLLWESQWGHTRNLLLFYQSLIEQINEVWADLYQQGKIDETFKDKLSETHKRYYEKFELLFKQIKTSASKRKTDDTNKLNTIYKGTEGGNANLS